MRSQSARLAAGLIVAVSVAGCASWSPAPRVAAQAMEDDAEPCDYATGSRIRPREVNDCKPNRPLRSYSKEQIDATGYIDLNDALRQLDPAFR